MEYAQNDSPLGTRRFRIWVQGRLDGAFSEGLAGIEQEDVPAGTMLSGAMIDQSQLHSVLDLLRSLGVDVLRFEVDSPRVASSTCLAAHPEGTGEAMLHGHAHESTERTGEPDARHDRKKG